MRRAAWLAAAVTVLLMIGALAAAWVWPSMDIPVPSAASDRVLSIDTDSKVLMVQGSKQGGADVQLSSLPGPWLSLDHDVYSEGGDFTLGLVDRWFCKPTLVSVGLPSDGRWFGRVFFGGDELRMDVRGLRLESWSVEGSPARILLRVGPRQHSDRSASVIRLGVGPRGSVTVEAEGGTAIFLSSGLKDPNDASPGVVDPEFGSELAGGYLGGASWRRVPDVILEISEDDGRMLRSDEVEYVGN